MAMLTAQLFFRASASAAAPIALTSAASRNGFVFMVLASKLGETTSITVTEPWESFKSGVNSLNQPRMRPSNCLKGKRSSIHERSSPDTRLRLRGVNDRAAQPRAAQHLLAAGAEPGA